MSGMQCMSSSSLMEMLGNSTEILSSLKSSAEEEITLRRMIGVMAGDGIGEGRGVGSSRIGERHLLIVLGISNRMVGGWRKLLAPAALCALKGSRTGTSMVLCR